VVLALDAWLGRYVGSMLASDIANLLENPAVELGDVVEMAVAAFDTRLAAAIAATTTEDDRKRLGVTRQRKSPRLVDQVSQFGRTRPVS
jgi:hypothetical protein